MISRMRVLECEVKICSKDVVFDVVKPDFRVPKASQMA